MLLLYLLRVNNHLICFREEWKDYKPWAINRRCFTAVKKGACIVKRLLNIERVRKWRYIEQEGILRLRSVLQEPIKICCLSGLKQMKKGKESLQWINHNLEILLTPNDKMVSSVTKITPLEALKKRNEFEVKLNIYLYKRDAIEHTQK